MKNPKISKKTVHFVLKTQTTIHFFFFEIGIWQKRVIGQMSFGRNFDWLINQIAKVMKYFIFAKWTYDADWRSDYTIHV